MNAAPRIKKLKWTVPTTLEGVRLDIFLTEKLTADLKKTISRARARALIVAGAVYLNRKRVRIASKELRPGAQVEAWIDLARLTASEAAVSTKKDVAFELSSKEILFEDEWLIAVFKPPGLPTQPTVDNSRQNLYATLKGFLKKRDGGDPYVGLHHRLDRDTSGVILFTKKKEVNAKVAELFSGRNIQKTYWALVALPETGNSVPDSFEVKNYLRKEGQKMKPVRSGGDFAETQFRVLGKSSRGLWIEAKPKTGRMHQIRVHLAEMGIPILGDVTYGSKVQGVRVMLHAAQLEFEHPKTGRQEALTSPEPEDFARERKRLLT